MSHASRRSRGAAATETLIVAVPLLLTGLGTLEAARWWGVRQTVTLAVMEAAREGSATGADTGAIATAMQRALLPLTAHDASPAGLLEGERRQGRAAMRLAAQGLSPWEIRVISPRRAHFEDFAVDSANGAALPDTYQAERHRQYEADGWPEGRGPASGDTVFAANTLVLEATYLHAPLVPGVGALLRTLGRAAPAGLAGEGMRRAGYLPMTLRVSLPMQTPAHASIAGAVIRPGTMMGGTSPPTSPPPTPGTNPHGFACAGLWCTPGGAGSTLPGSPGNPSTGPGTSAGSGSGSGSGPDSGQPAPWPSEPPATPPSPQPGTQLPPSSPGAEDGCGVILCCTTGAALPV